MIFILFRTLERLFIRIKIANEQLTYAALSNIIKHIHDINTHNGIANCVYNVLAYVFWPRKRISFLLLLTLYYDISKPFYFGQIL